MKTNSKRVLNFLKQEYPKLIWEQKSSSIWQGHSTDLWLWIIVEQTGDLFRLTVEWHGSGFSLPIEIEASNLAELIIKHKENNQKNIPVSA